MADEQPPQIPPPPDQLQLALERTFLAHERTLMAWVRTGTSLVAFGFALYRFFEYLQAEKPDRQVLRLLGPRTLGMVMVGIGVVTLILACWQHRQSLNRLRAHYPEVPFSPALVLAVVMSAVGLLALVAPLVSP